MVVRIIWDDLQRKLYLAQTDSTHGIIELVVGELLLPSLIKQKELLFKVQCTEFTVPKLRASINDMIRIDY